MRRRCLAPIVRAATVTNPGFESNVLANPGAGQSDNFVIAVGQGATVTAIPGWTFAATQTTTFSSYGGVSDLATANHAPEGALDNNVLWLFVAANKDTATVTASQTLTDTIQPNTRYTLTARVAQSAHAEGNAALPNPTFPTLGNGASTGDVFARLRAGNLATPMPGLVSSTVSVPADDTWVNWTLVWETGAAEPLAGQPLVVELFHRAATIATNLPSEVFFDDVAVATAPVPEPGGMALVVVGAAAMLRRRRRHRVPVSARSFVIESAAAGA